jgi:hypothetical protein
MLHIGEVLQAFDTWFAQGYANLLVDPRSAASGEVTLTTYERWFATQPPESCCAAGCWSEVPPYVLHTAGIPLSMFGPCSIPAGCTPPGRGY